MSPFPLIDEFGEHVRAVDDCLEDPTEGAENNKCQNT